MNRCAWPGRSTKSEKPWGYEVTWQGIFRGKEIHINKGSRTSLKFNIHKNELLYVQSGKIFVEYADEMHLHSPNKSPARSRELLAGEILNVQAGCPYRLSAIKDSVVFEISDSTHSDGRIIIEDDYGRATDNEDQSWIFNPTKQQ